MKAMLDYLRSPGPRFMAIRTFVRCLSLRPRLLFILSLALLPACAWSQSQLATVSGTVTDKSGAVILRASVVIVNQGTGLEQSTGTDTAGSYHFSGLPPGTYTIAFVQEKLGEQTQQVTLAAKDSKTADQTFKQQ